MTLLESCSECWHFEVWNNGGAETILENVSIDESA